MIAPTIIPGAIKAGIPSLNETAFSSVVALNYVAHESNTRWNVSYFKTTDPGTSTKNIVENLMSI